MNATAVRSTQSRTAQILAEMRQANHDANQAFAESVDDMVEAKGRQMRREGVIRAGGPRYTLATSKGRSEATGTAQMLVKGTEDLWDSNARKREFQAPRRAMSMAARHGRVTPDGVASVLAYFQNPSAMATAILANSMSEKGDNKALAEYLCSIGIEATPADVKPLAARIWDLGKSQVWKAQRLGGRISTGGRPRKVVERYSACVYLDGMILRHPVQATGRIPGGNDAMHGTGARRRAQVNN